MRAGRYTVVPTDGFNLLSDDGTEVNFITVDDRGKMEGYFNSLEEIRQVHGPIFKEAPHE